VSARTAATKDMALADRHPGVRPGQSAAREHVRCLLLWSSLKVRGSSSPATARAGDRA